MSLLAEAMEQCVMIDKRIREDGYGGYTYEYTDGVSFEAAIVVDTSMQAREAEKMGVTSLYTVTTTKGLVMEYHNIFKRVRDGKVFRVTSDGDDKYTPASATLDMRQVTAEEHVLEHG